MLTRFVRNQLIIFTIASIIGIAVMVVTYMQVPTLLGIGRRMTVKLELPRTGGLGSRTSPTGGVQLGKVTDVRPTKSGAEATLSLATSPKVPADPQARVLSVSAVGEQYADLVPKTDSGPYLENGSVIAAKNTTCSAGGRPDARPGARPAEEHSGRNGYRPAQRGPSRRSTAPRTI